MNWFIRFIRFSVFFCIACTQNPEPSEQNRPSISAKNVQIELARPGEQIIVRGSELVLGDGGAWMRLEGDASVEVKGKAGIEARANSITVKQSRLEINLEGDVRTRFRIQH
ncbi:MAG: hypothetical protein GY847_09920 [Proteobacteria bacterium]|nr:hypothetical protein [Pseudomonadota bacterium]